MKLESSIATVAKPVEEVYEKLTQASTYELLMPEEASFRIKDEKHFSFKLGGMPEIPLKLARQTPNTQIVMTADGGSVPFELHADLEEIDEKTKMNDFFNKNEIVLYKNISDLSEKLIKYSFDNKLRSSIAKKGRDKYFKYFNSTRVADFIISKTFNINKKFFWEKIN